MTAVAEQSAPVPKALIADDDPGIARFLANRCRKMGFEVQTAANGLQAMIMAGRNRPDVLIVDINMPELDGLSVCARLLVPDRKAMHVIVITASSYPESTERCASFGGFHVRKGLNLWEGVQSALIEFFPDIKPPAGEADKSTLRVEWKRPRVLVVDGDPDAALFLTSRLNKRGIDILAAHDAVQGFRMASKEEPSLIIADNMVPQGGANYLLSRLRTNEVTAGIPVIVMTAQRLDDTTRTILQRDISGRPGVALFLEKSFDTAELFAVIKKYCAFMENPS
jgi:DNA-binding response OmpR family regulator